MNFPDEQAASFYSRGGKGEKNTPPPPNTTKSPFLQLSKGVPVVHSSKNIKKTLYVYLNYSKYVVRQAVQDCTSSFLRFD